METNRELLKEAIADAKKVKEVALEQAKMALEEAFTPFLKEKLASKISEMDSEEETITEEEEEINLDELLAELDSEEENVTEETVTEEEEEEEVETEEEFDIEDMSEEDLKNFVTDVIQSMVDAGEIEGVPSSETEETEISEEQEETTMEEAEEMEEEQEINEYSEHDEEEFKKLYCADHPEHPACASLKEFKKEEPQELEEAYKTIKVLRQSINEVNLLNSKLIYINKIFKAKSLNDSEKTKIVEAFDKASTTKEAKLIYETLVSNIDKKSKKLHIKEHLGSASKTISQSSKSPIIESNLVFERMKKLAGLTK